MKHKRWAYHTTSAVRLDDIAREGLRPSAKSIVLRGTPVVFFGRRAADAYRYFIDREDAHLLRFPWPADATKEPNVDDCVSRVTVPGHLIERYDGKLLDGLEDAYYSPDYDDRFEILDRYLKHSAKIERSKEWAPLG
jgi:hypothetical protein